MASEQEKWAWTRSIDALCDRLPIEAFHTLLEKESIPTRDELDIHGIHDFTVRDILETHGKTVRILVQKAVFTYLFEEGDTGEPPYTQLNRYFKDTNNPLIQPLRITINSVLSSGAL